MCVCYVHLSCVRAALCLIVLLSPGQVKGAALTRAAAAVAGESSTSHKRQLVRRCRLQGISEGLLNEGSLVYLLRAILGFTVN